MTQMKPMLAHKFDNNRVDWSKPLYIQPKLDGVRCLITKDGAFSRTGKQFKNIAHIELSLKSFFDQQPDVILDGELYNHDLKDDFEKIISLVRKQKPTDTDRLDAQHLVQFHVYDYFDGVIYDSYKTRMNNLVTSDIYSYCVKYVPAKLVDSYNYARTLHKQYLDEGYEGSILRLNTEYQCKRSHSLRKFKDFHDTEATLTGWVEGKGKRAGTIGKFIAVDADGIEFGMPVMDKFKYLQENFDEMKTWVGKTATFTYFERTKANSYRHPLFKCIRNYE